MTELEEIKDILYKLSKADFDKVRGYINMQALEIMGLNGSIKPVNIDVGGVSSCEGCLGLECLGCRDFANYTPE